MVRVVRDKNENYNRVMRAVEEWGGMVVAGGDLGEEMMGKEVAEAMVTELLKTLPTREFEFSFLADYFMLISSVLHSCHRYHPLSKPTLHLLISTLSSSLRSTLLPYLFESSPSLFHS